MRSDMRLFCFLLGAFIYPSTSQYSTPFCEICLCTSLPNEPPTINCISEEIANIYNPSFWSDQISNEPYSIKAVILHYNNLNVLETKFPSSNLKELDLSRNSVTKLGVGIFSRLQEMSTLILSHNKIEFLNPHSFKGNYAKSLYFPLRALKKLDLEYNELHTLNADTFEHIDELEELNLGHNPFKVIDAHTQQALSSLVFLKSLNLAYTQLRALPEYFLHAPKHLTSLDLSGNVFESIPSALEYSRVTTLFFGKNHISLLHAHERFPTTLTRLYLNHMPFLSKIENAAFVECRNLSELHLNNNRKLSLLEKDAFLIESEDGRKRLPIAKLFLHNSNLSSLSEELVSNWSSVEQLDLSGNPWTCNCSTKWYLNISAATSFLSALRCSNPPEMKGFTFYDLQQNRTHVLCGPTKKKLHQYITILLILSALLLVFFFFIVIYLKKKRRQIPGPKFNVIIAAR